MAATSPFVETSGVCTAGGEYCFIDDGTNSWCLTGSTPIVVAGYEMDQTYLTASSTGVDYWTLTYRPYVKTNA